MKRDILLLLLLITILFSCKKDIIDSNQTATLHFSTDTIIFDTTFHSIGTPTKTLIIYNHNDYTLLTDISLNTVNNGVFRMNVDGIASNSSVNNVEILANDSIFVFLEVTPNENTENLFLLTNNLIVQTGTNKQIIELVSPGRNANFHLPHDNSFPYGIDSINYKYYSIKGDQTWTNDLPHVIYGQVVIEPDASLTIEEGVEIYFHNNSGIFVGNPIFMNLYGIVPLNNGTLIIQGSLGNEVIMKGDRLDEWYENIPGQWNGIHFTPGSINNIINYAIISNGNTAIRADSVGNNNPTLTINNTIIENMSSIGILGQGARIIATNTIVSKCGQYTVACNIGGDYSFTHCTFANYWNYNHRNTPSILLNNYYEGVDGNTYLRDLNSANFTNCIIYGSLSTEVSFQKEESAVFNYVFDHCLIKLDPTISTSNSHYVNSIINQDPDFMDEYESNFYLQNTSPAIDAGNPAIILNDIEGNIRNNPDLGVFEFQE